MSLPPSDLYTYRPQPLSLSPPIPQRSISRPTHPEVPKLRIFPKVSGPGNNPKQLPHQPPLSISRALSLNHRQAARMSMSSCAIRERRASQKIQQLMGHDIDTDMGGTSSPYRAASPETRRPTTHTNLLNDYGYPVGNTTIEEEDTEITQYYSSRNSGGSIPPLESDYGSLASNRSSVASKPCPSIRRSTSLKVMKTRLPSCANKMLESVPDFTDPFTEGVHWRGSTSYNYFSDVEVADEYHRIATGLANSDRRQSASGLYPDGSRSRSETPRRFSLSAKALFHKSRGPSLSKRSSLASLVAASTPRKLSFMPPVTTPAPAPAPAPVPVQQSVESSPRSVFDVSDEEDDEEENNMKGVIKDFFVRKSDDRSSLEAPRIPPRHPARLQQPRILSRTGGQVKELIHTARDGARTMQTSREDKRRNELRSRIRVIREEDNGALMI